MSKKETNTLKLDSIKEHFVYSGNPAIFMKSENITFKAIIERKFDRAEVALLSNSAWDLKYCIDTAKYFFNLSLKENVINLTNKTADSFENKDRYEDFIRAIGHKFLLPSIIFYNSSFDYLYTFIFALLTRRKEIIESKEMKKDKILRKTQKLRLTRTKNSWIFGLNSLITNSQIKKQIEEKNNKFLRNVFIEIFNSLKKKNGELKTDYYANMIKHQQIPFFKPKCIDNTGGAKSFVDINQFYSTRVDKPSISFGIPEIVLDLEATQKFLEEYHNITVRAFNYLLDGLFIE